MTFKTAANSVWRLFGARILFLAISLLAIVPLRAQVAVTLNPYQRQQFLDVNAKPLAGGKLCTFQAGTSTPLATYTDSTGLIQNTNPIILDSAGEASLWLAASAYRFVLYDGSGSVACPSSGVQQWTLDFITPAPFLSGNNTWTGNNTFSGTTTFSGPVNLNSGGSLNGSFSGSPAFTGAPSFTGGPLFSTVSPTFSVVPIFSAGLNSGILIPSPTIGTTPVTQSFTNEGVTGTTLNLLVKLTGAPSAVIKITTGDASGIIGPCVSGCGIGGTAQIAVIGQASCVFDSATTAGDYVAASVGTAGDCHDAGISQPASQVLGRVLSTNGGSGTYIYEIFPPEQNSGRGVKIESSIGGGTIVTGPSTAEQTVWSFTLPANELNNAGQWLRFTIAGFQQGAAADASSPTWRVKMDSIAICLQATPSATYSNWDLRISCSWRLRTPGAAAQFDQESSIVVQTASSGLSSVYDNPGNVVGTFDTTQSHVISLTVQWSAGATGSESFQPNISLTERVN